MTKAAISIGLSILFGTVAHLLGASLAVVAISAVVGLLFIPLLRSLDFVDALLEALFD